MLGQIIVWVKSRMAKKIYNWLKDRPANLLPHTPLYYAQQILEEWSNKKVKDKAEKLRTFLLHKSKLDTLGRIEQIALYDGVWIFLSEVWPEVDVPYSHKDTVTSGFKEPIPKLLKGLIFKEIMSILILDAAFNNRQEEALSGLAQLNGIRAAFSENMVNSYKSLLEEIFAESAANRPDKRIIHLETYRIIKKKYVQDRNEVIIQFASKIKLAKEGDFKHIISKSDIAKYLINNLPHLVKKNDNSDELLSIDAISRIIK